MSIYATWLSLDEGGHRDGCAALVRVNGQGDGVLEYINDGRREYYRLEPTACDCGHGAPIVYLGSHVNPDAAHPRGGSLQVAAIPNHCHPDARGTDSAGAPVDFLRFSLDQTPTTRGGPQPGSADVVLDRAQVQALRDTLTAWLDSDQRW